MLKINNIALTNQKNKVAISIQVGKILIVKRTTNVVILLFYLTKKIKQGNLSSMMYRRIIIILKCFFFFGMMAKVYICIKFQPRNFDSQADSYATNKNNKKKYTHSFIRHFQNSSENK